MKLVNYDKLMAEFTQACKGRYVEAFARGTKPGMPHTFQDANLNRRWQGWRMHAEWKAGGERHLRRKARAAMPSREQILALIDEVNPLPNRDNDFFYLKFAEKLLGAAQGVTHDRASSSSVPD